MALQCCRLDRWWFSCFLCRPSRITHAASFPQLSGLLLPPACTGAYPFETDAETLASAGGLLVIGAILYYARGCALRSSAPPQARAAAGAIGLAGRIALTAAVLLYPLASTTALRLLNCETVRMNAVAAESLDGGASAVARTASAGPGALATVQLLSSNPYFVCWAGRCVLKEE